MQIVEVGGLGRRAANWRLASAPEVVIGTLDGPPEQQLYQAVDATRLPDGRIVVVNSGTSELRFYGPDGTYISSAGAEGDGPGEFRAVVAVDVVEGDSLYAWDQRSMRVSVLDLDGHFARSFQLAAPGERSMPRYRGRFADGTCLVGAFHLASDMPQDRSVNQTTTTLLRYDARGDLRDTITVLPNDPSYVVVHSAGRAFSFFYVPFAPGGTWALDGMRLHEGTGETFEVRTRDPDGQLIRILRSTAEPIPVTGTLFDSFVAEQLAQAGDDEEWRKRMADAYAHMPRPDLARVFDALTVDGGGRLWVRSTPMPGDTLRTWRVYDPDGRYVARALIPTELRPREIGPDYVLALRSDELGVEQVVLFRIRKQGAI